MKEMITVEKEVYEAVLRNSLRVNELEKENERLKKLNQRLQRTQARQFRDNKNLQIKAEKAKDVVDFDKVQKIKQLKELLRDARNVLKMVDTYCGDNDSINGFLIVKRIDEVLK